MSLIKVGLAGETTYPYSLEMLRVERSNVSFQNIIGPDILAAFGVFEVTSTPPPSFDPIQSEVVETTPVLENGVWITSWVVVELSDSEKEIRQLLKASSVRADRDRLLASSDWTQVADAPVDAALWATYRQALRNVPSQAGFPLTVEWPVAPGA